PGPAASTSSSTCRYTARAAIHTRSLHDALPIWPHLARPDGPRMVPEPDDALPAPAPGRDDVADDDALAVASVHGLRPAPGAHRQDRKSTRLHSSHVKITYARLSFKKNYTKYFNR